MKIGSGLWPVVTSVEFFCPPCPSRIGPLGWLNCRRFRLFGGALLVCSSALLLDAYSLFTLSSVAPHTYILVGRQLRFGAQFRRFLFGLELTVNSQWWYSCFSLHVCANVCACFFFYFCGRLFACCLRDHFIFRWFNQYEGLGSYSPWRRTFVDMFSIAIYAVICSFI